MKLYEIEGELGILLDELSTCDDEARCIQLETAIHELGDTRDKKLLGICLAYKNTRGYIDAVELELARLTRTKKTLESGLSRIENYLKFSIGAGTQWESSDGVHKVAWRYSERLELKVAEDELPDCYVRIKREANKALLKEDIKMLGDQDGPVKLLATIEGNYTLKVK